MGEFDLIDRYFFRPARRSAMGMGDDCALIAPGPGMQLAVSCDMLVEGRHFLPTVEAARLGHKALAVNLSDLAACGAKPLAFTLALAMPDVDEAWLEGFSRGMFELADEYECELVGGDTTRGPLNICITVFGEVPAGQALLRSGAKAGDDIWVSGTTGDARLALEAFRGTVSLAAEVFDAARMRMERPQPRVALGQALRGIASACIDISDGLVGDLSHVLRRSGVGARVEIDAAASLLAAPEDAVRGVQARADLALSGGDDYELAFTAPADARDAVMHASKASATRVTRIGCIESEPGLRVVDATGRAAERRYASFDHFG